MWHTLCTYTHGGGGGGGRMIRPIDMSEPGLIGALPCILGTNCQIHSHIHTVQNVNQNFRDIT